ncbi:MAG: LysR family transcriptional regulator [Leptospiraceae bacterium]
MEFRQIRYFIEIHRQGSFVKAASALGLTQPALSRQIALLERELKQPLFNRSSRKISLTLAGQKLLEQAVALNDLWQETLEAVQTKSQSLSGDYKISTGGTIAAYVLPSLLKDLRKRHPALAVQVLEGDLRSSKEALLWGEADLGILTESEYHPELDQRDFLKDEILPVVSRKHPLASRSRLKWQDLLNEEFVFYHPYSAIRKTIEEHLNNQGIRFPFRVTMELRSVDAVIRSVEAGLGIGFISRRSVNKSLFVLPVKELVAVRNFHLSWRRGRPGLLPVVETILESGRNL